MPNLLDAIMAADAVAAFADPDAFGERAVFRANGVTQATATATLAGGVVASITVADGGDAYPFVPPVLIEGDGTGASATAVLTDGVVTAITVDDGGSGYTTATVTVGGLYVVVQRDPPYDPTNSDVPRVKMMVSIPVAKIPSIDSGGDEITLAYRRDRDAEAFLVGGPMKQDAGFWVVGVG